MRNTVSGSSPGPFRGTVYAAWVGGWIWPVALGLVRTSHPPVPQRSAPVARLALGRHGAGGVHHHLGTDGGTHPRTYDNAS